MNIWISSNFPDDPDVAILEITLWVTRCQNCICGYPSSGDGTKVGEKGLLLASAVFKFLQKLDCFVIMILKLMNVNYFKNQIILKGIKSKGNTFSPPWDSSSTLQSNNC